VQPGDNLWTIARDHLAKKRQRQSRPTDLSDRQIAIYWLRVVEANRRTLPSHDPDLIYPKNVVKLPPVDGN
jgi:LysM domain